MSLDLWLIRTHKNEILGPLPKEELISWIQQGKIRIEDEVCLANHYWIHLDEKEEVIKQLGIEMPTASHEESESTDEITLTETSEVETSPLNSSPGEDLPPEGEDYQEYTRVASSFSTMAKPLDFSKGRDPAAAGPIPLTRLVPQVHSHGKRSEAGLWRVLGTLLVVITSGLVIWILRILRDSK